MQSDAKPSRTTGKTPVTTAGLGSFPSYTSCFYPHLPALQFGLLMFSWMLVTADGCCRELHKANKGDLTLFSSFSPWDGNEGLFGLYIVPTMMDALGTSCYQQPLELLLQQCWGLSSQAGPQSAQHSRHPCLSASLTCTCLESDRTCMCSRKLKSCP